MQTLVEEAIEYGKVTAAGMKAHRMGIPIHYNPYDSNDHRNRWWLSGWEDCYYNKTTKPTDTEMLDWLIEKFMQNNSRNIYEYERKKQTPRQAIAAEMMKEGTK